MLVKTKGIVLQYIKYKETSIITKIYTEKFGLKSYIINGVRNKNSKMKISLFQPLTLLDLVVYNNEKNSLQRISEATCYYPYKNIPFNIKRTSIFIFISEVLNKTLKEDLPSENLFEFLGQSFIHFDNTKEDNQNFHLQFLLKYISYLGFSPSEAQDIVGAEYDLISEKENEYLENLIKYDYNKTLICNNETRRRSLKYILAFFKSHIEHFGELTSERILKEVLN